MLLDFSLKSFAKNLLLLAFVLLCHFHAWANNILVSTPTLTGQNISAGTNNAANYSMVQFNLSWDNSWRWNSTGGSISYIGVNTGGSGYTSTPLVYIGSNGAVAWQANTAVTARQMLVVSATPNRYYIVTADHTTQGSAPTHTTGTTSNLLFVSVSDGGGSGATATATVSGGAISGFSITNAGSGYTSIPTVTIAGGGGSGATTDTHITSWWDAAWVFVKFMVGASNPTFTGVSSSGTTVTVSSTANLRVGMYVRVTGGTGAFAANTVISSITNSTQFVVSATPTTLNNATIECVRIWEHALLNNSGHTAATGSTITAGLLTPGSTFHATTNPGLGAFIYRSTAGNGPNTFNNTQLRWNYGANGVADNAIVSIQVFAVEMVYVPGGVNFTVGNTGGYNFTNTTINTANATAAGGFPTGQTAPANASWPNGYNAFYCMKYEISQGQYRDFLNTLTYRQQDNRTETLPTNAAGTAAMYTSNIYRTSIDIQTPANSTTLAPAVYACNLTSNTTYNAADDGECIACNYLNWMDGAAYLDWAGLRPMTELEYEKACRGNKAAVSSEYAWGNTTIAQASGISSGGTNAETASNAGANCVYGNATNVQPLRVGAFAGAATTRTQAGATYYGIMEMSGNLMEFVVQGGKLAGNSYTGLHGDGKLLGDGTANVSFWPGINGNNSGLLSNTAFNTTGITEAGGSTLRGGSYVTSGNNIKVSDRGYRDLSNTYLITRDSEHGIRGVRNAP